MKQSNFALRLQASLLSEARTLAEDEGVALNQLINVALAEKLSARAQRASSQNVQIELLIERATERQLFNCLG